MRTPCFGAKSETRSRNLSSRFIGAAALIAACLCPTLAFGQTNSKWNGGTGNWSNATDWTPNGVPNNGGGNTYNVTIDSGGTDSTVLDINATINSLVLGGTKGSSSLQNLSGTAEKLNITGGLTVNPTGALTFSDGSTLTVGGNATITGSLDLENGSSLVVSGNLYGSFTMDQLGDGGSNSVSVGGSFTNEGTLDLGANTDPQSNKTGNSFSANHLVNNDIIESSGGLGFGSLSANTMINNGSLQSLNFVSVGTMTNNGGIWLGFDDTTEATADFGTLINNAKGGIEIGNAASQHVNVGTLNNKGSIDVKHNDSVEPALDVSGNIVNSGTITATSEGNIQLKGGSLNNEGLIAAYGSIIQISEKNTTNTGTLEGVTLQGGKVTNTNGMILSNDLAAAVLLEGGVVVTGGTLSGTSGGVIETPSGQTATLNGVTNSGAYVMANNSTTTLSGKITNNGTISLDSTGDQTVAMIVAGGATLAGSGTLTLGTGGPNIIEGSTGKEFLTNVNTIQGAGTIKNVGLINNGTILANAGTLAIAPTVQLYGFTNNASLIVDSGSAVNITGPVKLSFQTTGTVMISSGATLSVGGSSAFTQTKGTTTVDGNLSAANGIFISGGTLNGNGGALTGNLSLAGAVLSPGDGANKVGELTVSGAYSQTSTSFLDIDLGGTSSGTFDVLNINGSASLHGTLNVDALTGFTPTVGETFDILNYSSETGSFSTVACTFSNGDGCSVTYNGTDAVLTITAPGGVSLASKRTVSASPATRVSRNIGVVASLSNTPIEILSRITCFGARLLMASASCGSETLATIVSGGERRATTTAGIGSGVIHNNIMAATRAISTARGGASRESSASVAAMARLYACAYMSSSVAHTMGCN